MHFLSFLRCCFTSFNCVVLGKSGASSTNRQAPLMFWDLNYYKLHRNNNCMRVMWSQGCSRHAGPRPASHLDDAGEKLCVTGGGQAEERRAGRWRRRRICSFGLGSIRTPARFQHRVPGGSGRVVCRARAFPDRSRHSRQHGGKIFRRGSEVSPQSVKHMALGLIRFVQW